MEKNQFKVSIAILKKLQRAGILKDITLVGSWCIHFYKDYFKSKSYVSSVWTRDLDLAVDRKIKTQRRVNVAEILEREGFLKDFSGSAGFMRFVHPELIVEFLVQDKGRGEDKPYKVEEMGINAQPLRFIEYLISSSIILKTEGLNIRVPHPAAYALHKFLILDRRKDKEKSERDLNGALRVINALEEKMERGVVCKYFAIMHPKWQKRVIKNLKNAGETEIADILLA